MELSSMTNVLSTESELYELKSDSNVVFIYSTSILLSFSHFCLGIRLRYCQGRQDDNPPQACHSSRLVLREQDELVASRTEQHQ
jgi:hypothetical protein